MSLFPNADASDERSGAGQLGRSTLPRPASVAGWFHLGQSQDLITFSRNVATMVESGLPLVKILNRQKMQTSSPWIRRTAGEIEQSLLQGATFADALALQPGSFDTLYVNMVRAGEQSGRLDYALYRLADLLERTQTVQSKIKPLFVYPLFVLGVVLLDLVIFLGIVLPLLLNQAKAVLGESSGFLGMLDLLLAFWWAPLLLLVVAGVGVAQFFRTGLGKALWDEVVLYIPSVSVAVQSIQAYYFCLGTLMGYGGGLTLSRAAGLGAEALTNRSVREAFSGVEDDIESGKTLSETLLEVGYLPGPVMDMIIAGEESGELEKMLYNTLKHLETQIDAQIEALMGLLRPLLILTAVLILGSGLLVVYMGLFSFLGGVFQQAMSRIPSMRH